MPFIPGVVTSPQHAVATGLLQVVSNATNGPNVLTSNNANVLEDANSKVHALSSFTRGSDDVSLQEAKNSWMTILIWCVVVWLILVFFTLLFTSILPCLMGLVRQESDLPEVSVDGVDGSAEGRKRGNWLGALVTKAMQSYDTKKALGVDVKFGSIAVYVTTGEVEVTDIVVGSPDGYYSPLLQISKVHVDLDMSKLIYSLGADVEVEKTSIEDFTLTIEKTFTTSNLSDFLKFLSSSNENLKEATSVPQEPETPQPEEQSGGFFSSLFSSSTKQEEKAKSNRTMTLREVSLRQIGVKMGFYCLSGRGLSLQAGDLAYSDFDTQMCKNMGSTTVPLDIIPFLVMTLLRTILDNVLGDRITEVVQQGVVDACSEVMKSTALVNSSLVAGVQEGAAKVGEVVTAGADAAMAVSGKAVGAGEAVVDAGGAVVHAGGAALYSVSSAAASTASSLLKVSDPPNPQ